jgi:TP901 family phage tail tape measure protein
MAGPLALVWELIATDNASEVFKKAGKEAGAASKETEGMMGSFTKLGGVVALAGAALTVVAVKMAIDMQESTAKIQGNAQITQKAAVGIGDAFLATAGKSTFSGKEMSDAFGPVAGVVQSLSGQALTAADSMTVMNAATMLAEASGKPLSATTSDLAAVMQNYGLKVGDAADASNVLFNASRLTNIDLDTLTATVDKLHGKLGIASPSLKDTAALMVDLANHGISGSKGVMMVNAGLTTLLGGSKATTAELKTLNVHVFDASGKFVGMKDVLEQLTPKLADMTDKQRLAAEKALFGAGAAKGLNSTILAGVDGFIKSAAAVTKHNAAEDAAKAASETLGGQLKTLKATFSDLMIMVGEKVIPVIQKIVTYLEQHRVVAAALAVVVGVVMVAAMAAFAVSVIAATWEIILIVAAIAAIAAGLVYCWNHFETFRTIVTDVFHAVQVIIGKVVEVIITIFRDMLKVWTTVIGGLLSAAATVAETLHLPFAASMRKASDAFNGMAKNADDKLKGVADSASHWGEQAGTNYANGVGSPKSLGAARSMAASVASSVKFGLNIDTYSIGYNAAQGFASGIRAGTVLAVMAASSAAGQAQAAMAAGLRPPGHNALGTDNWRGGMTWVGERGPELVNLPKGSQVIPNNKISSSGGNADVVAAIASLQATIAAMPKTYQMGQRQMAGTR